ncbi:hypothetical protein Tsubulata_043265 [Turnera subulata]|uniref:Sulfotransferase n=1 Tax=Turnera subulata TaxID=218843 RepID=A0A9Q0FVC8_9ROSI|nr:hypothetical protein Tsubulata_043265 [Turnera subulata]
MSNSTLPVACPNANPNEKLISQNIGIRNSRQPTNDDDTVKGESKNFTAHDTYVIIASMPKSGTTWLKALTFSVVNRNLYNHPKESHPLLTTPPHELVPFFEMDLYLRNKNPSL